MRITSSEINAGQALELLLSVTLRGRVLRFATNSVTVTNDQDDILPDLLMFRGGLQPVEFEDAISIGSELTPDRSVSVSVLFSQDDGAGWAEIVSRDQDLGDGIAELSLYRVGDAWRDRRVIVNGRVTSPSYGGQSEPVSFTISAEPGEDRGAVLINSEIVSADTWPIAPATFETADSAIEQMYPIVYGSPGVIYATDNFDTLPAVPALIVSIDHTNTTGVSSNKNSVNDSSVEPASVLLFRGDGAADSVTIYNQSEDDDSGLPKKATGWVPSTRLDKLSQQVTHVSVTHNSTSGAGLQIDESHEIYWSCETIGKGGVFNRDRSGSMRNAAEIMLHLLGRSTLQYDEPRIRALEKELGGFDLDFFLNEQRSPYSVIQDDILPILPVSPVNGPRGLYFVFWNFRAEITDAIDEINIDTRGGYRQSLVEVSDVAEVFNELTINYALRADTGEYARALTVAPTNPKNDTAIIEHPISRASATRYTPRGARLQSRVGEKIETDVVYDPGTAAAVLDWKLRSAAMVRETCEFVLPQRYASLNPGDVVVVSDQEILWSNRVCLVQSITRGVGDVLVVVRTLPDLVRDL